MENGRKPRVVIVGAGFAGLNAAKALKGAPVEVLLIDQNNYHTFQPLLYQVATSGLEMSDIAMQVRGIFWRQKNVRFRQGTVVGVDWEAKTLQLADNGRLGFDYLILGAGAVYSDFGVPGVMRYGFFLKSLTEAANIRSHILRRFERASAWPEHPQEGLLNFVIVGAGPTGVEMAGALVELFDGPLRRDYPELDIRRAKVILLEMTDMVLPPFSEASRRYSENVLRQRGVDVRLNETVAAVREGEVELKSGEVIPTQTLLWAAGVRAHPLAEALGLELGRGYRVKVEADLSVPGKPFAFVAGDMAGAGEAAGQLYAQVAPVAIQQGKHAGRQVAALAAGRSTRPFRYFDKGTMAIIGRNAGVAELSKRLSGLKLRGFLGFLGWLFIHLLYLPGHQNRFLALWNWAYNYLTFDRHVRLITFMKPSPAEVMERTGWRASPEAVTEASDESEELVKN